jgi:hypothetical protein
MAAHGTTWTRGPHYAGFGTLAARLLEFAQEVQAGQVF